MTSPVCSASPRAFSNLSLSVAGSPPSASTNTKWLAPIGKGLLLCEWSPVSSLYAEDHMTSNADKVPERLTSKRLKSFTTFVKSFIETNAVFSLLGLGRSRRTAFVITPKVPSPPINNCLRSYPVLFFNTLFSDDKIVPSARTTSTLSTISRVIPYRITRLPPALVDKLPPIVALPRAPRSKGSIKSCASAAS